MLENIDKFAFEPVSVLGREIRYLGRDQDLGRSLNMTLIIFSNRAFATHWIYLRKCLELHTLEYGLKVKQSIPIT